MGALTGSITYRRYRVMDSPPRDFRDSFTKGVRAHVLVPLDPKKDPHQEKAIGWCSLFDEEDLDLHFDKFWLDGRILLSLRIDVIKPSAAEVKRALSARRREEEHRRKAPLSKAQLRDLKEQVVAELRVRTPPKVRTMDVVWKVDDRKLYFFSHAKGPNETFIELFVQTFGIALDLEGPGPWASTMAAEEDMMDLLLEAHPTAVLMGGFSGLRPGARDADEAL